MAPAANVIIATIAPEDDLQRRLSESLQSYGYRVFASATYAAALEDMLARKSDKMVPGLVVLGGLNAADSLAAIGGIRAHPLLGPARILVVNAALAKTEVPGLLDAGADDCYVREFHPAIYSARVRGLLSRAAAPKAAKPVPVTVISFAKTLILDTANAEVTVEGKPIAVSPGQYDLLLFLMQREGTPVPVRDLVGVLAKTVPKATYVNVAKEVEVLREKLGRFGQGILAGTNGYYRMSESLVGQDWGSGRA